MPLTTFDLFDIHTGKIIFMARTIPLVNQQYEEIRKELPDRYKVCHFYYTEIFHRRDLIGKCVPDVK